MTLQVKTFAMQAWQPEVNPQDPHTHTAEGENQYARVHVHTHAHTHNAGKISSHSKNLMKLSEPKVRY